MLLTLNQTRPLLLLLPIIALVVIHCHGIFILRFAVLLPCFAPFPVGLGLGFGFGFSTFTFTTITFLGRTGGAGCFLPFLSSTTSSDSSYSSELLIGLTTSIVLRFLFPVWSHPYLRALQPAHAAPNSSTSQSLFPFLHFQQANSKTSKVCTL